MQNITREQLQSKLEGNELQALVEVLPRKEFEKFHLPGAINVPVESEDFPEKIEQVAPDKEKPIAVYCQSNTCDASVKAAEKLDKMGYRQVFDYENGKVEWKEAGLPIQQ